MTDTPRAISPDTRSRRKGAKAAPACPPVVRTADGDIRRVGIEIEFTGVDVPTAADVVRNAFGGGTAAEDPHRLILEDTEFGDFVVELDARILHKGTASSDGGDTPILPDRLDTVARDALGKAVAGVVPVEIVTPPLPWPDLSRLSALTDALRAAGAKGTEDNILHAFGLHLNPEVPSEDTASVIRHLRAYFVLADWLRAEIGVDMTRRLMPHTDPFPRDYMLLVLDPDYAPGLRGLITDYLDHSPTRNRELDMLPLFRHLDEGAVTARLDDPLIKARPTFHYRLPDCALADPDWSPVTEWNRWVKVEELAADPDRLGDMARACRTHLSRPAPARWLDELQAWLET
ncbi:MAG: amidoligase enzyme [Rhodospirillales bacterium CG15_BIG_FIL_POST_REV_8_21_14_020_66_15]|nr:MAG: amidoligase enzyme [Rhodospirillales bacterium CG15_BIG_FIL_POST_REV_8_21_14_020_66_15]